MQSAYYKTCIIIHFSFCEKQENNKYSIVMSVILIWNINEWLIEH